MRVNTKACIFKPVERLPMRRKGFAVAGDQVIGKQVEFARGNDL